MNDSDAGDFSRRVLALQLSVGYSDSGITREGLGSLKLSPHSANSQADPGALQHWTVNQVLDLANDVLGGDVSNLPNGMTVAQLSSIIDCINKNFREGQTDNGYLY